MRSDRSRILQMFTPLLLHQTVILAVTLSCMAASNLYGLPYDAAAVVLAGNLLVLPAAARMYRKDRSCDGMDPNAGALGEASSVSGMTGKYLVLYGVFCFLAGGILNIGWSGVLELLHVQERFSNQVQVQLFASGRIVQVLCMGIIVPVVEELIFRGLTYRRMRHIFSAGLSAVLSALLFSVYHGNAVQAIFAFPMAIVLALLYERGKLFIFPVLFHMGSNLTAILLQILLS